MLNNAITEHFKPHVFAGKILSPPKVNSLRVRHTPALPPAEAMKRCRRSEPTYKAAAEIIDIEDINFRAGEVDKIRDSLLDWYDKNRRDLPWRRISDGDDNVSTGEKETRAYAVWVSEVMLQQTRVQTVIDYFNRWMEKWPSIYHLSLATLEVPAFFVFV